MRQTIRLFICSIAFWIACISNIFGQVSFEALVLTSDAKVGVPIEIAFELNNSKFKKFYPPVFPGLSATGPSEERSVSYKNGKSAVVISHKFYVTASSPGTYKIGAARIVLQNDKILKTKPIVLKVKGNDFDANSEDVFVRALLNKQTAYVGEQVCMDLKIYTRINVASHAFIKEPNLRKTYHHNLRTFSGETMTETLKGQRYTTKILKRIILFPTEAGLLEIGPYHSEIGVAVNKSNVFNPYRVETHTIQSKPVILQVKALKSASIDADVPIGQYAMQAFMDKKTIKSDDYINLNIEISGQGDIKQIIPASIKFDQNYLDIFDPEIEEKVIEGAQMLEGRKTFRYKIIPKAVGTFNVDCQFIFFDDRSNKLMTIDSSFRIKVQQGNIKLPLKSDKISSDSSLYSTPSKSYKADKKSLFYTPKSPFSFLWIFFILALAPVIIGLFYLKKIRQNPSSNKSKSINIKKSMQSLESLFKEQEGRQFYKQLLHFIHLLLKQQFDLEQSQLSKNTIREVLQHNDVDQDIIKRLLKLIRVCENSVFASNESAKPKQQLLEEINYIAERLQASYEIS